MRIDPVGGFALNDACGKTAQDAAEIVPPNSTDIAQIAASLYKSHR